ncbi:pyrimidine 5'-nucleotidase [Novosphingobium sp. SL115]|uniref:pyrimidine 5'-nucleotidase n=1 Tax=Novosphingobium sp. SL115 TaxID=2995150 RepID=UPI00227424D5|nr:pyrimidine 5'-nucleotidase [Novosphingobium sp. SL115]MCY1671814.1 pyrimidine 5'-nucleotidase [Novosphingobium sp. SL115]
MAFDPGIVDCWIFDLDNTLYSPSTHLFDQIDLRMGAFIEDLLGCDPVEARRVQKLYFHDHGTTLSGLMHYHAIDPHDFLGFVHDIDFAPLAAAPRLGPLLSALPGRKLLFTNGDDAYARRVLNALDLNNVFDGMWDIHAMNYRPKPEISAYTGLVDAFAITPEHAVFVEDMARNLAPAKALGMQTVWLDLATDWGDRAKDDAAIDVVADDVQQWLTHTLASLADRPMLG